MSSDNPFTRSSSAGGGACKKVCSNGFDDFFSFDDFSEKSSSSFWVINIEVRGVSQLNIMRAFLDKSTNVNNKNKIDIAAPALSSKEKTP